MSNATHQHLVEGALPLPPKSGGSDSRKGKATSPEELLKLMEFLGLVLDNVYSGIIVCDFIAESSS